MPAWTALPRVVAPLSGGPRTPEAITVSAVASPEDLAEVPIARATRLTLERAEENAGLMLTKGGALSRADAKALFDATERPDLDRATVLAMNKVLSKLDVLPACFHG